MKNWQKWLLIFRDIFYGLFVAKLAWKWHRVCKIKSWKSKSDLSFSIWLKVGSLEVSNAKSVHANNRWLHCAILHKIWQTAVPNSNKENLLFLQNRLPRTFNVMFYRFYCFICLVFLLFSVSAVFCFYCFNISSIVPPAPV